MNWSKEGADGTARAGEGQDLGRGLTAFRMSAPVRPPRTDLRVKTTKVSMSLLFPREENGSTFSLSQP